MTETRKAPSEMTDDELVEAYEANDAEAGGDSRNEALIAEIARRNLDI